MTESTLPPPPDDLDQDDLEDDDVELDDDAVLVDEVEPLDEEAAR